MNLCDQMLAVVLQKNQSHLLKGVMEESSLPSYTYKWGRDGVVYIATSYSLDGPGIESQ